MSPTKDAAERAPQPPRKPYEKPELIEYGSIAKLTQGTATIVNDAGGGMRFMMCL